MEEQINRGSSNILELANPKVGRRLGQGSRIHANRKPKLPEARGDYFDGARKFYIQPLLANSRAVGYGVQSLLCWW